jgi:hypothetical protein
MFQDAFSIMGMLGYEYPVLGMLFPFRYCQIAEMDAFSNMGMPECGIGIARSPKLMPLSLIARISHKVQLTRIMSGSSEL